MRPDLPPKATVEDVEKQQKAVQALRSGHRAWDSVSIDFGLAYDKAVTHPHVAPALLQAFTDAQQRGRVLDTSIVQAETLYRSTNTVDTAATKELTDNLATEIKACKVLAKKLNTICNNG
jgi:hypothetical protein